MKILFAKRKNKIGIENVLVKEKCSPSDTELLKKLQIESDPYATSSNISFLQLLSFSDCFDKFLICVGLFTAVASGILFPICFLMYGKMAGIFIQYEIKRDIQLHPNDYFTNSTHNSTKGLNCLKSKIFKQKLDYDYDHLCGREIALFATIGIVSLFLNYLSHVCWNVAGERQIRRIRYKFFESVIRQDIAFFDHNSAGELSSIMTGNIEVLKLGINYKVADFVYFLCRGAACLTLGLLIAFKFSVVFLILIPLMILSSSLLATTAKKYSQAELSSYESAGKVAQEALGSLRSVLSLGIQRILISKYSTCLDGAELMSTKKGLLVGLLDGLNSFLFNSCFVVGIAYGVYLTRVDCGNYGPSNVVTAFFSIMNTTFAFGQAFPFFKDLAEAKSAARRIFHVIETRSLIGTCELLKQGKKLESLRGEIEFKEVCFSYPSRLDAPVLRNLSFKIAAGKTVALVGSSGSGKSTIVALLQRFYMPISGSLTIDGEYIENLDVNWLRSQMALVSQEPALFGTTIRENIRLGRLGATDAEVEEAAKMANAHNFIMTTADKYDTQVGERGAQLSGGQKQRIAIARALIRNPKILLLDEATSALDYESEKIVQEALDKAKVDRTTIIVAHRLSTIRNADLIVALEYGRFKEMGTHDELMAKKSFYFELASHQTEKNESSSKLETSKMDTNIKASITKNSLNLDDLEQADQINTSDVRKNEKHANRALKDKKRSVFRCNRLFKYEAKLLKLNWPEFVWIQLGCVAQLTNGILMPITSIIFSEIYRIFKIENKAEQNELTTRYMLVLCVVAVTSFAAVVINNYSFGLSGSRLVRRIRVKMFSSMLRQEVAFHDLDENSSSSLAAKLSVHAPYCTGSSGEKLGMWCQALGGIGFAVIFSFVLNYKLTTLMLLIVPLIFISGVLAGKFSLNPRVKSGNKNSSADEEGGRFAAETIENMRTVISLGREHHFLAQFRAIFTHILPMQYVRLHMQAFFYALSNNLFYFIQLCAFSYGFHLIKSNELTTDNLFQIYSSITMASLRLARVYAQLPDQQKSKEAAREAFRIIERKSAIDSMSEEGLRPSACLGDIRFENVYFRYPNRPNVHILNGLNLVVKNGQTNALVGTSGCGKSTTIALLLRFYDVDGGAIYLDGVNIRNLNIGWLRSKIGLVSQEPVLFNMSIYENICYGDIDREKVPMEEIINATTKANIHYKISNMPSQYETVVGNKGSQLSGGEKQRIAIARGLIRQPQILLLDEATSALDNQSEKVVQDALDKAKEGRTCIVIAHRLSTIENANKITVVKDGVNVEEGTHVELMHRKQFYFTLQKQ